MDYCLIILVSDATVDGVITIPEDASVNTESTYPTIRSDFSPMDVSPVDMDTAMVEDESDPGTPSTLTPMSGSYGVPSELSGEFSVDEDEVLKFIRLW